MALPATPKVEIRFGTGAGFGNALVLGSPSQGILGTSVLGTSAALPVDVTSQVTSLNIRRGRDRIFDHYDSGVAVLELYDDTGDLNPENPSGPYYGDILPLRQIRISASYSGNDYYLFSGYITSWDYTYPQGADLARVNIVANDGFRLLNLAEVDTIAGASAGQDTGDRVADVLAAAGWPSSQTTISTGSVTVQDDPGGIRQALTVLQQLEDTELGALYMDAAGNAVFKSKDALSQQATTTKTYFDDTNTNIQYQAIDVTLDDTDLANDVTVTRVGGTAQNAQDATSISNYYRRSLSRTGLLMETDTQALSQANSILNARKSVGLLIRSIGIDCSSPSNRVAAALELDIGDPIQVTRTTVGGPITADLTVQGVTHQITPGTWFTTFTTAIPLGTAFVLGSSEFGILGTSTL